MAKIFVGLGFGDETKGSFVDHAAHQVERPLIIRFNGGSQAAHNVITPEGVHHTFSQFGSGMFAKEATTFLSRFMIVDPIALFYESQALEPKLNRGYRPIIDVSIDNKAMVLTPFHRAANRLSELARGDNRHGSVGVGISSVVLDSLTIPQFVIRIADLANQETLLGKLKALQSQKMRWFRDLPQGEWTKTAQAREEIDIIFDEEINGKFMEKAHWLMHSANIVNGTDFLEKAVETKNLIFEGAQGILLDENRGFHPYTTWTDCTKRNAFTLLSEIGYEERTETIGVMRPYMTRHGAGPLPTEDESLSFAEKHNDSDHLWQSTFRFGYLDMVLIKYAIECQRGVDSIAIGCIDHIEERKTRYEADFCFCDSYRSTNSLQVGNYGDLYHQEKLRKIIEAEKHDGNLSYKFFNSIENFITAIQNRAGAKVKYISRGPTRNDKDTLE